MWLYTSLLAYCPSTASWSAKMPCGEERRNEEAGVACRCDPVLAHRPCAVTSRPPPSTSDGRQPRDTALAQRLGHRGPRSPGNVALARTAGVGYAEKETPRSSGALPSLPSRAASPALAGIPTRHDGHRVGEASFRLLLMLCATTNSIGFYFGPGKTQRRSLRLGDGEAGEALDVVRGRAA